MTIQELQAVSEAIASRAEASYARLRMLQYVAGCHSRDVRDSLVMSRGAKCFAAERIAAAAHSARLAWRVAVAIEAES